jgi:hypothetical protein
VSNAKALVCKHPLTNDDNPILFANDRASRVCDKVRSASRGYNAACAIARETPPDIARCRLLPLVLLLRRDCCFVGGRTTVVVVFVARDEEEDGMRR